MRAAIAAVVLCAATLTGCSTVKVVQRDNCWVRQTKHFFLSREELGPCSRAEPQWADDRLTRITQECVAQADYRWQSRAVEAWGRGEALPDRPSDEAVQTACMDAASRSELAENERLKQRLSDLSDDRDAMAARADENQVHLLATYEQIAGDLGEAARRVDAPANAIATSTSEGRATSDGRSTTEASTALNGAPASANATAAPPPLTVPRPTAANSLSGKQDKSPPTARHQPASDKTNQQDKRNQTANRQPASSQESQAAPSCECPPSGGQLEGGNAAVEAKAEDPPGTAAPTAPSPQTAAEKPSLPDAGIDPAIPVPPVVP